MTVLYAAVFTPAEEGGYVVTFPDVPEAITQGESIQDCIKEAADALEEAIIGRINTGKVIPEASAAKSGDYIIPYPLNHAKHCWVYCNHCQGGFLAILSRQYADTSCIAS